MAGERIAPIVEYRSITGSESKQGGKHEPLETVTITDSPGDIVGTTYWEEQTIGSSGNRCVVDEQEGVHFTWTNAWHPLYPEQRGVYFNYVDSFGDWLSPVIVSQVSGADYGQIAVRYDDRAVITYYSASNPIIENYVMLAEDQFTGFGIFQYFDPPDMLIYQCYHPYICIDQNTNIHIVHCENNPVAGGLRTIGYTNSTDEGYTWSAVAAVDTISTISQNVVASPVSNKVAIVYTHPCDTTTQWKNDIYYIESQDGLTWDWQFGKVNITNYGGQDSLFAYTDLSAIYDSNDNLNIAWNAEWVTGTGVYYKTFLFFYNSGTGIITQMRETAETWPSECEFGAWNRPISKVSLGVQLYTNNVFAVYTLFDSSDCSAGGFANGEIHMQYSYDNGNTWSAPTNLTNSPTPGCTPGDCDSDHWPSLAEVVNGYLHIIYVNDKDAGNSVQNEGVVTSNLVKYLKILNPLWTPECVYVVGDVNGSDSYNGLDITYGVNYFKGGPPPSYECECTWGDIWYVVGDVNGSCAYNGLDITFGIEYLKMNPQYPELIPCPDCPPAN